MKNLLEKSLSNVLRYLSTSFGKAAAARTLGLPQAGPVRLGQTSAAAKKPQIMPTLKPAAAPKAMGKPIAGLAPAGRGGLAGQAVNPIERLGPLNGAVDGKPGANVRHTV